MTIRTLSAEQRTRKFHTLDLLRGLAALAVVGLHLNNDLARFVPNSHLAVDLFFVLSGFVISHAYEARLNAGMGPWAFFKKRIVRLFPLYLLGTVIGAALVIVQMISGDPFSWSAFAISFALSLLFLPTPSSLSFDNHVFPFNFPAWSLFWELVINAAYALLARRLTNALLLAIVGTGSALLVLGAVRYDGLAGGSLDRDFWQGGMRVVYSFFAGVGVYRLWVGKRLPWVRMPAPLAGIVLAGLLVWPTTTLWYDVAVAIVGFPLLVLAATEEPRPGARRACTVLGLISYPIYVLHAPFARIEHAVYDKVSAKHPWVGLPLEVAFVLGLAIIAFYADRYYDRPVREAISR